MKILENERRVFLILRKQLPFKAMDIQPIEKAVQCRQMKKYAFSKRALTQISIDA